MYLMSDHCSLHSIHSKTSQNFQVLTNDWTIISRLLTESSQRQVPSSLKNIKTSSKDLKYTCFECVNISVDGNLVETYSETIPTPRLTIAEGSRILLVAMHSTHGKWPKGSRVVFSILLELWLTKDIVSSLLTIVFCSISTCKQAARVDFETEMSQGWLLEVALFSWKHNQ